MADYSLDLDEHTIRWVQEIADLLHTTPAVLIASIVRDVAQDDIEAHLTDHRAECRTLN
jgi:hypothetical protein